MNGLFIPLPKGAWNSREFWGKIPGYPGFFVHAEMLWKSLKSQEDIFTLSSFFLCAKKPGNAKNARSSGLFRVFLEGTRTVSFLDSTLTDICLIKFIVMRSKLVLLFSERKK